uniref:Uncharacterized protein n=1 Tax=Anguilla anguilla TaxID=7936 RepID=A0A0E9PLQ4_ANGAN
MANPAKNHTRGFESKAC